MEELIEYMNFQLEQVKGRKKRYIYSQLPWASKMFGLIGARGVGKTTVFLQKVKELNENETALYVTCDHLYFTNHTLFELASDFFKNGGQWLFIDEVHKYPNWSRELKLINDTFPNFHTHFTGSSILSIMDGDTNLSRRAVLYEMKGLSFREFLSIEKGIECPVYSLEEILEHNYKIPGVTRPLPLFKEYLKRGYYPYSNESDFKLRLEQDVNATLEVDIPQYANYSAATARKLRKLMSAISESAPFKPNFTQLASLIEASRTSLYDYLEYMGRAGMIANLPAGTGFKSMRKTEKIYLENTALMNALCSKTPDAGTIRETFFFNQVRYKHKVSASQHADFCVGDLTFEVGGKSKTQQQIKNLKQAFIVKDNIEQGYKNIVPLWAFGLMY